MKSITNIDASGSDIPPIIHADMKKVDEADCGRLENLLDRLHLAINSKDGSTSYTNDEPTVDETISETASEFSSCSEGCDEDVDGINDNDSSDDEVASTHSDHSNNSTRHLLKQAQLRLHHQSICEEVDVLRAEVVQYKQSLESALRQKLQLKERCHTLEIQLDEATKTIHNYKRMEQKWNDETSQREKEFMNQINDLCSETKVQEQYLMGEIIQRDKKIVEMQNRLNDNERSKAATSENDVIVVSMESEEMVEMDMDDDSWSDDASCHFI